MTNPANIAATVIVSKTVTNGLHSPSQVHLSVSLYTTANAAITLTAKVAISSQNTRIGVKYNRDEKCTCNNSAHESASYTWIPVFKLMIHE